MRADNEATLRVSHWQEEKQLTVLLCYQGSVMLLSKILTRKEIYCWFFKKIYSSTLPGADGLEQNRTRFIQQRVPNEKT